jgi:IclR family KDG regulon transcriptional repressor
MSQLELHREAFDPLKFLVNKIGETANICVLEGTNLIYMLKVECQHAIRLLSHVGKTNPASSIWNNFEIIYSYNAMRG